jgi:hypothetical protein
MAEPEQPQPQRPEEEDEDEAQRRFADDLVVRGEAVAKGEPLPPGATHEIEEDDGKSRKVRRRRFSAS